MENKINWLCIMHPTEGTPPLEWTNKKEWDKVIDNWIGDKITRIPVKGKCPNSEFPKIQMARSLTLSSSSGIYTLDVITDVKFFESLEYLRAIMKGGVLPIVWYEDSNGDMYGQNDGIQTSYFNIEILLYPEITEALNIEAKITIKWRAQTLPDRIKSPFQN